MKFSGAIVAVAAALFSGAVQSSPIEAYGQLPKISDVVLSPDGARVAFIVTDNGVQSVAVLGLSPPSVLGGLKNFKQTVRELRWADANNLLVIGSSPRQPTLVMGDRREWFTLQNYDLTSHKAAPLLEDTVNAMNVILGDPVIRPQKGRTTILVTGMRFVGGAGLASRYDVDLITKHSVLVRDAGPGGNHLFNSDGAVIASSTYDDVRHHWTLWIFLKGGWKDAYGVDADIDLPNIIGFSPDGSSVVIGERKGGEFDYRPISMADGKAGDVIAAYAGLSGLYVDEATAKIYGGERIGPDNEYKFFDPADQANWSAVLRAFPGEAVEFESMSEDRSKFIVRVIGHKHGVVYVLVDNKTHALAKVGDDYVGIGPHDIAEVQSIAYKAADGRMIPAYLTLPSGAPAKNLPLVVLPHGGPAAVDSESFDWLPQALASHGYAVLQPQFRGSDMLGWDLLSAGFGQWGRKMQTDLSDGVDRLAAQGTIDPKRVCIVGASYGGYAALAGVTLQQGIYRCAVSVAGLSDLRRIMGDQAKSQGSKDTPNIRYWDRFMGSTKPDDPVLDQISPVKFADKITVPVLLIHGKNDTVVPIEQSQIMADAMKKAGKPVEFVVLPGEDHWLSRSETREQMLQATVKFLEANNPPG